MPASPPDVIAQGALARLNSELSLLPRALKRIAEQIQRHPGQVIYQSVTELAESAGAGDASVIRLCQTLGFKGFQDFKLALAADLSQRPASDPGTPQSADDVLALTFDHARRAIDETSQVLDPAALVLAAGRLVGARHIEISGQGASGVTALDFAYKLMRLGRSAGAQVDAHLAAMRAVTLGPGDVAVAISRSGSTIDTVSFLKLARQAGAFTVALTISQRSPIAEYADCLLRTANPEGPAEGGSVSNKISQMLVLDVLHNLMRFQLPESEAALRLTAGAVTERSY